MMTVKNLCYCKLKKKFKFSENKTTIICNKLRVSFFTVKNSTNIILHFTKFLEI